VSATAAMSATATMATTAAAASERSCLDRAQSNDDNRKDKSKLSQHHILHHGRNGVLVSLCCRHSASSGAFWPDWNVRGEPVDVRLGSVATVGLLLRHSCSGKH
jgi:hypothetical protein